MTQQRLSELYKIWAGESALSIKTLPLSGSNRIYYRIVSENKKAIGVFNEDKKENQAFIAFTKHFISKNLSVPEIYAEDLEHDIYLQQDLGDTTLFTFITNNHDKEGYEMTLTGIYEQVIDQLLSFQFKGSENFDYSYCYPRESFDKQSMRWDLTYFKYYFLKLAKIPFDEQNLENDYNELIDFLLTTDCSYFMYRDFQSRNIMIDANDIYFIDYQGGRQGALQYDLASLLYDAKADLSQEFRNKMLKYYISKLQTYKKVNETEFMAQYYGYVLIRILQAFGTYGYRGFFERKEHFLLSIPYAIKNITWLLANSNLPIAIPDLRKAINNIAESEYLKELGKPINRLTIRVKSFSYRREIPQDEKGNGGGFVFDCRALPNPGRFEKYKLLTGNNEEVINFLEVEPDVKDFLYHIFAILDISVKTYTERGFADLLIQFGCTGGQHRSVYCANRVAEYLKHKYDVKVIVQHVEREITGLH